MRVQLIQSLFVFFLASVLGSSVSALEVCDEMSFLNKPDLSAHGVVKKSRMMYAQELWYPGEDLNELPPQQRTIDYVASTHGSYQGVLIPDIEHWPTYSIPYDEFYVNLDKLVILTGWIKSATQAQLSMYGQPPATLANSAARDPSDPKYQQWQDHNDEYGPLTDLLDVIIVPLYTVNDDRDFWVNAATGYVSEGKRISGGKPIYAFLAPNYHDVAAEPPELRGTPVEKDFFWLQLHTLEELGADCAVIWAVQKTTEWDENAPWWQATKEFLQGQPAPTLDPEPMPEPELLELE